MASPLTDRPPTSHAVSDWLRIFNSKSGYQPEVGVHDETVLHPEHLADLLAPSLPGAACRNRAELFDRAAGGYVRADVEYARSAGPRPMSVVPSLAQCRAWFDSLPVSKRPRGVIAGQVVTKRWLTRRGDARFPIPATDSNMSWSAQAPRHPPARC